MRNASNSISVYHWEKFSFSANISNFVMRKIISTSWKMANISFQKFVISDMITNSFLIQKWGALEIARRYDWEYLVNLGCLDSIRFGIFQFFFGFSLFSAKCFDRNFRYLFSNLNFYPCTLLFLNIMRSRRLKFYQKIYLPKCCSTLQFYNVLE